MRRAYGPEHPDVVLRDRVAGTEPVLPRPRADAERNIRWALTVTDPHGAASPMDTVRFGRFLVTMLVDQQRWKEAEPLALRVLAIQDSLKDTLARVTAGHLATIYGATGQSEQAARYRGLADAPP